ncbi:MAG: molybdenum cofactor biosynthesis protein MoaE [Nitriliruptoraceae bacterium]|nr:molybdenum cofactor biosynthesis protein MoaE [Nitriliruptoraceae bacterium]
MDVEVRLFGGLAERAAASRVVISVEDSATVADLRAGLASAYPSLAGLLPSTNVALDLEIAEDEARLLGVREVALLPPVAGGASRPEPPGSTGVEVERRRGVRVVLDLASPPFDVDGLTDVVNSGGVGASVSFLGTVRDHAPDLDGVVGLEYSAYPAMARKVLSDIADELIDAHPDLLGLVLIHALGELPVGAHTILILASAAHRDVAFDAGRDALERVKDRTPIWKRELTRDGHRWVGLPDTERGPGIRVLPPAEAATLLDDDATVVLDVRTDAEVAQLRIPGAQQLDFHDEHFPARLAQLDPHARYLLYCRSGQRTAHVRSMMAELGFIDVVDVRGGLMSWVAAGLPTDD